MLRTILKGANRVRLLIALRLLDCELDDLEFSQRCLDVQRHRLQGRRSDVKSALAYLDMKPLAANEAPF